MGTWIRSCWYRDASRRRKEALEGRAENSSRHRQRKVHRKSLGVEKLVSKKKNINEMECARIGLICF